MNDHPLPPALKAVLEQPVEATVHQVLPDFPVLAAVESTPGVTISKPSSPFIDMLKKLPDARTENGGQAFTSTDSPLVDLFFDFGPGILATNLAPLLDKAWAVDPVSTLRIIFHARSIHEGKGFAEGFHMAAGWLFENHPKTLLANLHLLVDPLCKRTSNANADMQKHRVGPIEAMDALSMDEDAVVINNLNDLPEPSARPHGTWDDLLDLLVLAVNDQLKVLYTRQTAVKEACAPSLMGNKFRKGRLARKTGSVSGVKGTRKVKKYDHDYHHLGKFAKTLARNSLQYRLINAPDKKARKAILYEQLVKQADTQPKFNVLYATIVDLFVQQLQKDLELLTKHRQFLLLPATARSPFRGDASPYLFGMSLAAKWAPTPSKSADRQTLIATAIAARLFPSLPVMEARVKFQSEILTPLRKALEVPESAMGSGSWSIDYAKVSSRCMKRNAANFMLHDQAAFQAYLSRVAEGKVGISGATLFPHEVLLEAIKPTHDVGSHVADLQWRSLVKSISDSTTAKLQNCLAVADVSGSMGRFGYERRPRRPEPIHVCIALTLLLAELAAPPWSDSFITFSSQPRLQRINMDLPLSQRCGGIVNSHWQMNTDFEKVFELILTTAIENRLPSKDMVKRLFVFSDMQFDEAAGKQHGETEFAAIKRKFSAEGYQLPELVFWNLATRGSSGTPKPVKHDERGVTMLSGYSGALMKYFLGLQAEADLDNEWADEEGDPVGGKGGRSANSLETVMRIIGAESFKGVKVVD